MNQSGFADLLNRSIIDADSIIIGTLILPNLDPNSIPYIDSDNTVQDRILNNGQLVVGVSAGAPVAASLTGTSNQVNVTNGAGSITLSTPQDIATTSSPTFNNISLTSINTVPVSNYIITPSTSDLNMNTHAISNVTSLNGTLVSNYLKTPSTVDLDMNNHYISNFNSLRPIDTNVNIGNTTSLSLGGIGQVVIGDFTTSTGNSSVCIGLSNIARNLGVAIGKETYCGVGGVSVGYRSQNNQTDVIHIGRDNFSNAISADIFGVNRTNTTANSLLLGNGSYTNIRANNTCDLGTSVVPFQSIYSNASIAGTTNSRLTNDIVSNTSTGTLNNIVSFVSDKVIKDSGIAASTLLNGPFLPLAGGTMASAAVVNANNGSITNLTTINSKTTNDIVTSAVNGALNMVATYAGTSKAIQSSGTLITDLATTSALTAGLALKVNKAGDTMSGALAMGTNNITNVGALSGGINSRTADNILSSTVNPTYGNLPMWSLINKVFDDSGVSSFSVVTGPTSATDGNIASYNLTTGKIIKDSTIASTNVVLKTGTTMVGNIAMGTNSIAGTGAITSNTYVANNTISIGTALTNAQLQLSNSIVNRKIILFESTANDHQYYGFGINSGILRYQIDGTGSNHVFYAGTSFTTSNELMRLTGGGNLQIGTSAAAVAKLVVSGGVQNVGGEDSCIRAISALNSAKIELQCTNGSGRLYEFRSLNNGNLDIVDRSAGAGRLTLDTLGNLGIAMTPTGGGNNGLFIANGAGPTITPAAGGALYVNAGRLFYRGGAGTVTLLAPA